MRDWGKPHQYRRPGGGASIAIQGLSVVVGQRRVDWRKGAFGYGLVRGPSIYLWAGGAAQSGCGRG